MIDCYCLRHVTFLMAVELLLDVSEDPPRQLMFDSVLAIASELPVAMESIVVELIIGDSEEELLALEVLSIEWEGFETLLLERLTRARLAAVIRGARDLTQSFDFVSLLEERMPLLTEQGRLSVATS